MVARYTYDRPTYHIPAAKKTTKNKGNTKKRISRKKPTLTTFLESRLGQKQKQGEDRLSNRTRQNNKVSRQKDGIK